MIELEIVRLIVDILIIIVSTLYFIGYYKYKKKVKKFMEKLEGKK